MRRGDHARVGGQFGRGHLVRGAADVEGGRAFALGSEWVFLYRRPQSAQNDPAERSRHERFIVTRMMMGVVTLACLPPYLLWRGVPSWPEHLAIVCLVSLIVAALVLSQPGRLPAVVLAMAMFMAAAVMFGEGNKQLQQEKAQLSKWRAAWSGK